MKFLIEGSAFPALDNIKSVSIYAGVYLNVEMTTGVWSTDLDDSSSNSRYSDHPSMFQS